MFKVQILSKNTCFKSKVANVVKKLFKCNKWKGPVILTETELGSIQTNSDFLFVDMSCPSEQGLNNNVEIIQNTVNVFLIWPSKVHSYFLTRKEQQFANDNLNFAESEILTMSKKINSVLKTERFDYCKECNNAFF
ncbi:TPA: hypothetical protein U5E40_001797 [Yersinia enterocolitica]|nr:hypothetical protein [Yersinia enterocolitica]